MQLIDAFCDPPPNKLNHNITLVTPPLAPQDKQEAVFQVKAGDNLGWRLYEGTIPYDGSYAPGGVTSVRSVTITPPILDYNHSGPFNSITGGYVYRGTADPCLSGKYLYADLYGRYYSGSESVPGSGLWFGEAIGNISCAPTSPINCTTPFSESYVYSWAQDENHDLYL